MQTKTLLRKQAQANLRRAILDAARELLSRGGYENLSMRRLAASVGYAPRTLYLYFTDKDDLLSELIEEDVGRMADRLEEARAREPDPTRRLYAVALAYVRFGLEHPHIYQTLFMIPHHPLTRQAARLGHHTQGRRLLHILARAVREAGCGVEGPDGWVVVQTLRCALHGVTSLLVLGRKLSGVAWEEVVSRLVAGVVGERSFALEASDTIF